MFGKMKVIGQFISAIFGLGLIWYGGVQYGRATSDKNE
jgi:hypothetical protein